MGDAAQGHRFFQHRIEHGREIAGRGVDDLQDLGHRGFAGQRFVALGRPLIQLALGVVPLRSGLLELASEVGYDLLRIG